MKSSNMPMVGRHGWVGKVDPCLKASVFDSFSVGVFEWLPKVSGRGLKRSKVKVRVVGPVLFPERVYEKAYEVMSLLDVGRYYGPKRVVAK